MTAAVDPDGRESLAAASTRADSLAGPLAPVDASIGVAGHLVVKPLRTLSA